MVGKKSVVEKVFSGRARSWAFAIIFIAASVTATLTSVMLQRSVLADTVDPAQAQNDAIKNYYVTTINDALCKKSDYIVNGTLMQADYNDCRSSGASAASACITITDGNATIDIASVASCIHGKNSSYSIATINKALTKNGVTTGATQAGTSANDSAIATNKKSCEDAKGTWDATANTCTPASSSSDGKSTCSPDIGAIGWIVCPVVSFVASLNDNMEAMIDNLLEFNADNLNITGNGTNAATYNAWKIFRNYANLAFIIAFMIVIFSQVSSMGINNYGIKRLLPRLIVAAILINLSFYLCQIAVDISNILGYGARAVFDGIINTIGAGEAGEVSAWKDISGKVIAGSFVVGAGAVAIVASGGIFAFLALLVPVLFSSLIAFLMIVVILVARQALIILLITISPLAFVAYLLPNTEQWFRKWWKLFSTLLLLFPIVSAVFGASKLASSIVSGLGGGWQIVALGIIAIPAFTIPGLLKGSLNAAGALGAKLQGFGSTVQKDGRGWVKGKAENSRVGEAVQAERSRKMKRIVNRRIGGGPIGKINHAIDSSRFGRYIGGEHGAARAVAAQQKMNREAVDNSVALLENSAPENKVSDAKKQLLSANKSGDVVAARAAAQVLRSAGTRGRDTLHAAISEMTTDGATMHEAVSEGVRADGLSAGVKAYDSVMDEWNVKGGDISKNASNPNNMARLNESEIAGQSQERLIEAAKNRTLTSNQAQRVLDANEKGTLPLDDEKKALFQQVAARNDMPAKSTSQTDSPQPANSPTQPAAATQSTTEARVSSTPDSQSQPSTQFQGHTYDKTEGGLYIPRS